jgi:hypothetical protein
MEKRRSKLIVYWTNLGSFTGRSSVTEQVIGSNNWLSNFNCRRAIRTSFLTLWSQMPEVVAIECIGHNEGSPKIAE